MRSEESLKYLLIKCQGYTVDNLMDGVRKIDSEVLFKYEVPKQHPISYVLVFEPSGDKLNPLIYFAQFTAWFKFTKDDIDSAVSDIKSVLMNKEIARPQTRRIPHRARK